MEARYLDHLQRPRNVGDLPEADGQAEVENPVCGDRLRLALRLAEGRLSLVRYRVQGCSAAIASASALSELALGRTLAEAEALTRDEVEAALGGLPTLKRHGADLALAGLRAALARAPRTERPQGDRPLGRREGGRE